MRLLIVTQYFPPETGAAQNRLMLLATRLEKLGVTVTILTAMPNYPSMKVHEGYRGRFYRFEVMNGLPVHRAWIFTGTSKSIVLRLLNYFSFVKTSFLIGLIKTGRQDFIFCESPPLFLGISAWLLARFKRAKLVFNVSDLWPESAEKLGLVTNKYLLGVSTVLEEFLYRQSAIVTGQTQGIVQNISYRFPMKKVLWLKNGVLIREVEAVKSEPDWRKRNGFSGDDLLIAYAGILGHAQGLEVILRAAAILTDDPGIHFVLIGNGPVRDQLIAMKEKMNLKNVTFWDNRPKPEVLTIISACDASVVPLKKLDLFKGAIPSKIFENLALKKPLLLGVEGEAKEIFIDRGKAGYFFEPENEADLAEKVRNLKAHPEEGRSAGERGYQLLVNQFNPDQIAEEFLAALKKIQ